VAGVRQDELELSLDPLPELDRLLERSGQT
jgi:hypothetical protein